MPNALPDTELELSDEWALQPDADNAHARPRRAWTPSAAALNNLADAAPSPPERAVSTDEVECIQSDEDWAFEQELTDDYFDTIMAIACSDPASRAEAFARLGERQLWRDAEISEYRSHKKNGTFGPPVDLPPGFRAIPCAGIYKLKRDGRYKYRIVVRGYHMKLGRDYNETFAPVAFAATLRSLFALAAKFDWEIKQGDVSTAFLCTNMDTEVYVTHAASGL